MFSSAPGSLVAMHNLTASDLGHVVKMGGIANPSMAVVNSDVSVLDNFGEITLIAPRGAFRVNGRDEGEVYLETNRGRCEGADCEISR